MRRPGSTLAVAVAASLSFGMLGIGVEAGGRSELVGTITNRSSSPRRPCSGRRSSVRWIAARLARGRPLVGPFACRHGAGSPAGDRGNRRDRPQPLPSSMPLASDHDRSGFVGLLHLPGLRLTATRSGVCSSGAGSTGLRRAGAGDGLGRDGGRRSRWDRPGCRADLFDSGRPGSGPHGGFALYGVRPY